MANVKFSGTVLTQATPPVPRTSITVTVTVTLPDKTTDTLTATTDTTGAYTATKTYTAIGAYSAIATVPADAQFDKATSPATPFTITLAAQTVTLNVNLS